MKRDKTKRLNPLRSAALLTAFLGLASSLFGAEYGFPAGWGFEGAPDPARPGERQLIRQTGAQWVRVPLLWQETERQRNVYDFSKYDDLLIHWRTTSSFRILFVLMYGNDLYIPADGGRPGASLPPRTPEQRQAFALWAAAAVDHFRGHDIVWQIGDEPNRNWHPAPDANEFVLLASATTNAIKEAAPGERLIPFSLGCDGGGADGLCEPADLQFAEASFRSGILQNADAVSIQFYPLRDAPELMSQDIQQLRAMINQHDPTSCKRIALISGKIAYPSAPFPETPEASEVQQAKIFARAILLQAANRVPLFFWHHWRDLSLSDLPGPESWTHHSGLVRLPYRPEEDPVYGPKPSHNALSSMISFLGGFDFDQRINAGAGSNHVLRFTNGSSVRYAAWTSQSAPQTITIPGIAQGKRFLATDHFGGNGDVITASAAGLTLTVTDEIKYIHETDMPDAPENVRFEDPGEQSLTGRWNASAGATGYRVDVARDAAFTQILQGYSDLDVNNSTDLRITGLAPDTLYFLRVRAYNAGGRSPNSATAQARTLPTRPNNQPPMVHAGSNQTVVLPNFITLNGTATDDGLPNPPGRLSLRWRRVSGPGEASFSDPAALSARVSFAAPGEYVLELMADDGELARFSQVTIQVQPPPPSQGGNSSGREIAAIPNPFNPAHQTVSFGGVPANAVIKIHNRTGIRVRTIQGRPSWDGTDDTGQRVPSGIYFVLIEGYKLLVVGVTN